MPTENEIESLADLLDECESDPDLFNAAVLGRPDYWWRQAEICGSVVRHRTTVVPTGNSVGKSYLAAGLVLWWLYTRPGSLVVTTAPSQTLLGTVLFKEIRRAKEGSLVPLPGGLTDSARASPQTLIVDATGWQVLGIATRGVERLSGHHNPDLLVVVDEASGVEDEIWEALDSQNAAKLVVFGNPIRAEGRFKELALRADREAQDPSIPEAERVHRIRIPSTESPDVGLDRSPRGLADRGFLVNSERQYGRDSIWWRTHVEALFPEVSADVLIPEPWLDWASRPEHAALRPALYPGERRIAVDLGEGVGRDRTVVLVRDDLGVLEVVSTNTADLADAAGLVFRTMVKWTVKQGNITYDALGVGKKFGNFLARHAVTDAVRYAGSGGAHNPREFTNLRSEAAWRMHLRFDPNWSPGADSVKQPPFHVPCGAFWPAMREELKALSYELVGTQTKVLNKEAWCEILGRSPDFADALLQSFARP